MVDHTLSWTELDITTLGNAQCLQGLFTKSAASKIWFPFNFHTFRSTLDTCNITCNCGSYRNHTCTKEPTVLHKSVVFITCPYFLWFQNMDKKTRTSVYVMVVNEVLDDWEDAKIMGE